MKEGFGREMEELKTAAGNAWKFTGLEKGEEVGLYGSGAGSFYPGPLPAL